jgi:RND family efflux transporter MFP subunit
MGIRGVASAVGVGLLLSLSGCGGEQEAKPRPSRVERLPRLATIRPELHDRLEVKRTYTATVEAFEKADLCAQVRGVVKPITPDIDIGRAVKAGEPLLELDIPDILAERANKKALLEQSRNQHASAAQTVRVAAAEEKEAEAQVARFQADVEFRKLHYARVRKLAQTDTVAQQLADESQLQLSAAKAALTAAQAQVVTKQARAQAAQEELKVAESRIRVAEAELARLEALVGFATVRAPFDGVITKRWIDTGATVKDPSMPLLTVMRTGKVRVLLDVPERDVPYLIAGGNGKGNRVELEVPVLRDALGQQRFVGTVTLTATAIDPVTRTMRTEVHLDQGQDSKVAFLRPQMTGTATVVLAERKAMTVPSSALVRVGSRVEVYYVGELSGDPPRGVVKNAEVQLGIDDGKRVEIRSERLTGRELIIVKGSGVIHVGDQVIPVPARVEARNAS